MLSILFTCIFLIPALAGWGRFAEFFSSQKFSISLKCLAGILIISLLWTVIAFFTGLSVYVELCTLLIGFISFFYFRIYAEFIDFLVQNYRIFILPLLLVLLAGSFFPFILDHFGYYVPTVQWITEFGLVKGISNLDLLLGQMSIWHVFQAGFSHFTDPFLRVNVVVLIIYLLYILEKKSWIHLIFVPFLFLFSQSPSPDLPVITFSLIILNEFFFEKENMALNHNYSFLFAFSAYVFAIKPTMIWLPIFVFLTCFFSAKSKKHILKSCFLGTFIFAIFFLKNIWCFGFPVFPVQIADFGLSWKPNSELLQISSQTAIEKTFDMQYKFSEIQQFSTSDYVINWLFLKGMKSKIHLFFLLTLIVFTVFAFFKKNKLITILCVSILFKSILVLLFSAQYRFFIDVFFVVFFIFFVHKISRIKMMIGFFAISFFFIGFLSSPALVQKFFPSFKLGQFMSGFQKNQLLEPSYFQWKKFKAYQIGNLKFNVVEKYPFSFDVPIPAISPEFLKEDLQAGIFPQKNSENLKDGFFWRKLSPEEKRKLQKIVEDIEKK